MPDPDLARGPGVPVLLDREFFARPAREVAPQLLGAVLEHDTPQGTVAVELTEVEAYEGLLDPASHSFRGRTARNAIMWGPPGFAYVYFTYGMHFCVNVVCQPAGTSAAVLVRAGRVVAGEPLARERRTTGTRPLPGRDLARGPGRLCQALAITREQNGLDFLDRRSPLRLRPGEHGSPPSAAVSAGPRVGVSKAADVPWRFWLTADPTVSVYRPAKPRTRLDR